MHPADESPVIQWTKGDETFSARWQSERNLAVPGKVMLADDTLTADMAYRLACEGTVFLWQSDFQNARQLMQALVRRVDKNAEHKKAKQPSPEKPMWSTHKDSTCTAKARPSERAFWVQS